MKFLLLGFISTFYFTIISNAQKIIISGEEKNRKLTWSDFTGKPDKESSFYAYTAYSIKPKVEDIRPSGDSMIIGKFEVILELDPKKTWVKKDKQTDELLIHEQGHFNLGILCLQEILSLYKKSKFTKGNFSAVLNQIFSGTLAKYHEIGLKYDQETEHSKNKEQQEKWNTYFQNEVKL